MFPRNFNLLVAFFLVFWSPGVAAAECKTDVTACSVTELCSAATTIKRGHLEWNFDSLDHVVSAKNYGLNCGVDTAAKPAEKTETVQVKFTKTDFIGFNQLQRHQIQYALNRLGYYSSGVDGLWGKGTERAVNRFILAEDITENLAENVYKSLTIAVDVSNVTVKPVAPSTVKKAAISTRDGAKICRLNNNPGFERMLTMEEFIPRAVKEFETLREIKIKNGMATIGKKEIKQRENGAYQLYTRVRCIENTNGWSKCGTFSARTSLSPKGNDRLSGKILLPSQWPLYNGQQHTLEYTCSSK